MELGHFIAMGIAVMLIVYCIIAYCATQRKPSRKHCRRLKVYLDENYLLTILVPRDYTLDDIVGALDCHPTLREMVNTYTLEIKDDSVYIK